MKHPRTKKQRHRTPPAKPQQQKRPQNARKHPQPHKIPPEAIQGHHGPRKRTRNPDMLPAIIPDKLPTISPDPRRATHPEPLPKLSRDALPPHHRTPATLARMPQDERNEHRPNKYTPTPTKARHGPHRRPATGAPSKGPQPQNQVLGPNVKFRKIYLENFDPPQFSSGIFPVFKTLFVRLISRYPLGRSKWFTDGAAKNFQKFLRRIIKWENM